MRLSKRSQVDPFIVMDVMEAARAAEAGGRRIVHMEVGQPSTSAPLKARQAVAAALPRLGFSFATDVRQGKRFEITVDGDVTPAQIAEVEKAAEVLLANPVIETFTVRAE